MIILGDSSDAEFLQSVKAELKDKEMELLLFESSRYSDGQWNFDLSSLADFNYKTSEAKEIILLLRRAHNYQLSHDSILHETIHDYICKLLLLINHIMALENVRLHLILPYFPYSRQDRSILNANSNLNSIITIFGNTNISSIATIDIHNAEAFANSSFDFYNLNSIQSFANILQKEKNWHQMKDQTFLLSPDIGSSFNTQLLLAALAIPKNCIFQLKKIREDNKLRFENIDFQNKEKIVFKSNCIIVDDIVHSSSTVIGAIAKLSAAGLSNRGVELTLVATHFDLLDEESLEKLGKSRVKRVVTTDSLRFDEGRMEEIAKKLGMALQVVPNCALIAEHIDFLKRGKRNVR